MVFIKLSICIPTYNRFNLFQVSLQCAINSIKNYHNKVEIVISENPSMETEQNLISNYIKSIKNKIPNVKIKYQLNSVNVGAGGNFIEVVNLAEGDYCWIIGDDDFIKPYAIENLINKLEENSVDFLALNYDRIYFEDDDYFNQNHLLSRLANLKSKSNNLVDDFEAIGLSKLIHPKFNNVYLGAIMGNVFKKSIWDSFQFPINKVDDFTTLEGTYPFIIIFAKKYMKTRVNYISNALITVGEGARAWANGKFWESSLPLIYINIIPEYLKLYKSNGLELYNYRMCLNQHARLVGNLYVRFYFRILIKRKIKNRKLVHKLPHNIDFFLNINFYIGILSGFIYVLMRKDL